MDHHIIMCLSVN